MLEAQGDLWDFHQQGYWICITVNSTLTKAGRLVMGKGCAREARDRFPGMDQYLGGIVHKRGFVGVRTITRDLLLSPSTSMPPLHIITFPTKHNWWEQSSIKLIEQSARELVKLVENYKLKTPIYLPQPGCGAGGLRWEDVKLVIAPILPNWAIALTQ